MRWALGVLALFAAVVVALELVSAHDHDCGELISTQELCYIDVKEDWELHVNPGYDEFRIQKVINQIVGEKLTDNGRFFFNQDHTSYRYVFNKNAKLRINPTDGHYRPTDPVDDAFNRDRYPDTGIDWGREASTFDIYDGQGKQTRYYVCDDLSPCITEGKHPGNQHRDEVTADDPPAQTVTQADTVTTPPTTVKGTQTASKVTSQTPDPVPDPTADIRAEIADLKRERADIESQLAALDQRIAAALAELESLQKETEPDPEPVVEKHVEVVEVDLVVNTGPYRFVLADIIWHDNGTFTFTPESLQERGDRRYCYDQAIVDEMPENAHPYLREVVENEVCT